MNVFTYCKFSINVTSCNCPLTKSVTSNKFICKNISYLSQKSNTNSQLMKTYIKSTKYANILSLWDVLSLQKNIQILWLTNNKQQMSPSK